MSSIIYGINWLDIAFITILLGMIYKGSHAGVGSQVLSLAWVFVLLFFSLGFYDSLASGFFSFIKQNWARPISFLLISIISFASIKFLEMIFNISTSENLAPFERIGGAIIASLRTFVIFGIITIQLLLLPVKFLQDGVNDSKSGFFLVGIDAQLFSYMAENLEYFKKKSKDEIVDEIVGSSERGGK